MRVSTLDCEESAIVRPLKVRARITNKLRVSPHGLDGRSERGRRWRDLLEALIAEYGTANPEKLRELASLKLSLEATQAAIVAGDILRSEDVVRLGNLISRRERELWARQRELGAEPAPSSAAPLPVHDLTPLSDSQLDSYEALVTGASSREAAEALRIIAEARRARAALSEPAGAETPASGQCEGAP